MDDVLNATYAAYGTSWDAVASADTGFRDLAEEALFLSRLLVTLLPAEPALQTAIGLTEDPTIRSFLAESMRG